ncbi:PaaI family thioesterase [Hirschia maritima]|uniref:PaaI family thioesterase n=1 Tax=Hirschia maritima TaxID=1121961 RepID=UPI0003A84562|nr:PaaI family thioesterase [Hirschia maritima]
MNLLKQSVTQSGFSSFLGAEPVKSSPGEIELIIPLKEELTQHHGFAHGAVVGAAADNACAWAAASVAGDVVTSSYTLQLLAPAIGNRLRAHGKVIKKSKRQVSVHANVFAEDETNSKLVATALASIAIVEKDS